jgi:hypothetical protein
MRAQICFIHRLANHSLHSKGFCLLFLLVGGIHPVSAQDQGNTSAQEYGDAVYRTLGGIAGFVANYNHTAIFSGLNSGHNGRVRQALGAGTTTAEVYFANEFTSYGSDYYGAYTLNNRTMTFTDRKNVVKTASDLVNAAIAYPPFNLIPVALVYYGSSFDGTVADISNIRCDGVVEYCYEKNGFRVWRNQSYGDNTWSIVSYPDYHNDRPDLTRNPEREASPWAQRGAPCATGPNFIGCSYTAPDTKMNRSAVINLPTYQVTQTAGNGYVDVTVRATDESGIHYIGYKRPGDVNWNYSLTQPQDPTSDSYSYTIPVTSSGYFYAFAMDNGGNYPSTATEYLITVVSAPSAPTLASPSNGATGVSTSSTLSWNSSTGATSYRLQVSTNSSFSSLVYDQSGITGTSQQVSGLANNTLYYWRVNATNAEGTSSYSSTWSFTTAVNPPANPNGQNIAPLATVTVSATGSCYQGTCPVAAGVKDGSTNGPGAFWSGADQSSTGWVKLTLDQVYMLSKIRVFSQYWDASVYGTEGGLEYSVLVSLDGSNWTVVCPASFALKKTVDNSTAREDISFTPRSVRYIKVDITNSTGVATHLWRTAIREIEAGDANLPLNSWGKFTSVEQTSSGIPNEYHLFQNYPNPFNPVTTIEFSIPKHSLVVLTIFNSLGMEIEVLLNQHLAAGHYRTQWTPRDIPSGVYFYRLRSSQFTETKKLLLLR